MEKGSESVLVAGHDLRETGKTFFLTEKQVKDIQFRAKAKVESKILVYYVGKSTGGVEGYAFFETRDVRTMPATVMVVVDPDGSVRFVEILAFYEPLDYLPRPRWLELFAGRKLDKDLRVRAGIPNVTGASLTVQSVTDMVRKILATYEIAIRSKE